MEFFSYVFAVFNITGHILSAVSLFTLTVISVDRLFALLLGLSYRQVVTLKRIYRIVVVFWVLSTAGATMLLWNERITSWSDCVAVALCEVTSIFSYTKILITLRHNQIRAKGNVNQGQPSQTVQLNIARYKRTVSSALWVQVALVVCYLPFAIEEVLRLQRGVIEPDSFLLEDQRSERSSKGHTQWIFLLIELILTILSGSTVKYNVE